MADDTTPVPSTPLIGQVRWDRSYRDAMAELRVQFSVPFSAVRYTGIDALSHAYFEYTEPARLASLTRNVSDDDRKRYGGTIDRYFEWLDEQVRLAMAELAPGDLFLIVSGWGMDVVSLPTALISRVLPLPRASGTHDAAPEGFLLAYGGNVSAGEFPRGSIVDLAPTVLYYLGVPIGRDMDGYARTDIFELPFTLGKPLTFIATHER